MQDGAPDRHCQSKKAKAELKQRLQQCEQEMVTFISSIKVEREQPLSLPLAGASSDCYQELWTFSRSVMATEVG